MASPADGCTKFSVLSLRLTIAPLTAPLAAPTPYYPLTNIWKPPSFQMSRDRRPCISAPAGSHDRAACHISFAVSREPGMPSSQECRLAGVAVMTAALALVAGCGGKAPA